MPKPLCCCWQPLDLPSIPNFLSDLCRRWGSCTCCWGTPTTATRNCFPHTSDSMPRKHWTFFEAMLWTLRMSLFCLVRRLHRKKNPSFLCRRWRQRYLPYLFCRLHYTLGRRLGTNVMPMPNCNSQWMKVPWLSLRIPKRGFHSNGISL